jgi:hypothetical protein
MGPELTLLAIFLIWCLWGALRGFVRWLMGKPTKQTLWTCLRVEGRLIPEGARWIVVEADGSKRSWQKASWVNKSKSPSRRQTNTSVTLHADGKNWL